VTHVRPDLQVAALSGEVDAVMRGIVDRLMALPHADGASLSTVDGDIAFFDVCAGEDAALERRRIPLEDTLGATCLRARDLVVLRRTTGSDVERCLTPGAASIVLAPLEWDGEVHGILGVRSSSLEAFDAAGVEEIRLLAAGASIALRNAQVVALLADSERNYRELHAHAADAVIVTDDRHVILDANEAASDLLFWHVDELRGMSTTDLFDAAELVAAPLERYELLQEGGYRGERPFLRKDGTQVMVEYSSRVLQDGRVHTAMRDVTSRKRDEERIRTNLRRMHAIVQTQQEISELEHDAEALTRAIVERAQELTGADGASVQWFDRDDAVVHHCCGIAAGQTGLRLPRATTLSGLAGLRGETLYAADTATDPRVDASASRHTGCGSLICSPLHRDGEVVGILSVMARATHAFDELAIETARLMAEFVSTVIRNANELDERRRLVDELRTQEQVVEHMLTGLWVWKVEGETLRLQYANQASERETGLPGGDLVGEEIREILPALPPAFVAALCGVCESGDVFDVAEFEYGDARIPPSIFAIRAFPLSGERIAVTFENVTEVTRSRRALQESEARFRGAFNSSAVGTALAALDGSFVQVNDRLAAMLGYTPDELMRLSVAEISHADDVAIDFELTRQLVAGDLDGFDHEKRYLRKDGRILWGHLTASLVRGYDGAPTHVVAHVQDVTAQKEANLLYESTFERSIVAKLILDDDRRIVDVNAAGATVLGLTHDEALGMRIDDLLPDEAVEVMWKRFVAAGVLEGESKLTLPNGQTRRVEFAATANVQPGRHITTMRDLTRQKELESQLRQAQKMEAVGRLAGGIAHDFNNLLTAISGYSEFLISGVLDDRMRRHAEEIKKAAARAAALTGQLLAFSRRQVLQPRTLDLNAVVTDMDMMLRRLIGEDVELVTLLDPDALAVRADPTQVEQVIVNLAVNARDAMPHGGSVTIETTNVFTEDADFVELRLTDTGIGMTEVERQQLFDPFFTTKEGGTGLGLATVYGIVEQSGGTIEVDSSPGLGSSFRILFPAVQEEADRIVAPPARDAASGEETILLVEDEAVVRQLIAEILETSGYTVLMAADGPSALELLRRHPADVDLLVTDVVMPGMSGPEVASAVTAMRPATEVLYISGYTDQAIGHHGVLEPGIAFLQKPFSADDLTHKVRSILDGASVPVD
jgi:PAS domain S-box-containing protein